MDSLLDWLLRYPTLYRLWQAPFHRAKIAPLLRHNDLSRVRRVLDVGCGPGTNSELFQHTHYLGFDINPAYVSFAQGRHGGHFEVGDVTTWQPGPDEAFDLILVNSLLHHIDDVGVRQAFSALRAAMTPDGHLHLLELVTPDRGMMARWLDRADRGKFSRSVSGWIALCEPHFEPVIVEPFRLSALGVTLWNMVYFMARPR